MSTHGVNRSGSQRRTDQTAFADHLDRAADEKATEALYFEAASIAVERNRLGPNDASKWLELETRSEKFESEHYPGDDIIADARERLRGVIGR